MLIKCCKKNLKNVLVSYMNSCITLVYSVFDFSRWKDSISYPFNTVQYLYFYSIAFLKEYFLIGKTPAILFENRVQQF